MRRFFGRIGIPSEGVFGVALDGFLSVLARLLSLSTRAVLVVSLFPDGKPETKKSCNVIK